MNMIKKPGTTSTSGTAAAKPSLKDNKTGTKKEVKPVQNTGLVKKETATKSNAATNPALKAKVAENQAQPNLDDNPEFSKPTELRFAFIQAIQTKDYQKALNIAEDIKKIEPNNALITAFQDFLHQNIESLKADDAEEEEGEEGEEDEDSDEEEKDDDDDDDEKDEDEDEEESEENEDDNENSIRDNVSVSQASTADQTERSHIMS